MGWLLRAVDKGHWNFDLCQHCINFKFDSQELALTDWQTAQYDILSHKTQRRSWAKYDGPPNEWDFFRFVCLRREVQRSGNFSFFCMVVKRHSLELCCPDHLPLLSLRAWPYSHSMLNIYTVWICKCVRPFCGHGLNHSNDCRCWHAPTLCTRICLPL